MIGNSAEGEGFEPPVACATTDFKSVALVHSAIPPDGTRCGDYQVINRHLWWFYNPHSQAFFLKSVADFDAYHHT
jgi:hypothetical protein